jgi:hypothetical protein
MSPFFYKEETGAKVHFMPPPFPCTPNPRRTSSASLRTILLDDSEHLLHNHSVSVASLRLLFTFGPECRSASHRNWRSPLPEYPLPPTATFRGQRLEYYKESEQSTLGFARYDRNVQTRSLCLAG